MYDFVVLNLQLSFLHIVLFLLRLLGFVLNFFLGLKFSCTTKSWPLGDFTQCPVLELPHSGWSELFLDLRNVPSWFSLLLGFDGESCLLYEQKVLNQMLKGSFLFRSLELSYFVASSLVLCYINSSYLGFFDLWHLSSTWQDLWALFLCAVARNSFLAVS